MIVKKDEYTFLVRRKQRQTGDGVRSKDQRVDRGDSDRILENAGQTEANLDKAPCLSISVVFWILSSDTDTDTICQLNQFNTNSEAAMQSRGCDKYELWTKPIQELQKFIWSMFW